VPIFYATGNRNKAFIYSFLSGLAEPVGAGIAYLALRVMVGVKVGHPLSSDGILFGAVGASCLHQSGSTAANQSGLWQGHESVFGLISGMVIMALSLLLMK